MGVLTFTERVSQDATHSQYYSRVKECLMSYQGIKSRCSIRCDSFRYRGELLAKISVGGKTLKLYVAASLPDGIKASNVNKADSVAYNQVPLMLPLRSDISVRKAIAVIESMMKERKIFKA